MFDYKLIKRRRKVYPGVKNNDNSEEGESVSLPIKDRLLMSAVEREKAIKWISEVLE